MYIVHIIVIDHKVNALASFLFYCAAVSWINIIIVLIMNCIFAYKHAYIICELTLINTAKLSNLTLLM